MQAKKDLVRIEDAGAIEDVEDTYSSSDEMLNGGHLRQDHSDDDSDIDPDEERERYSHVPPLCSCDVLDVTASILSGWVVLLFLLALPYGKRLCICVGLLCLELGTNLWVTVRDLAVL